MIRSIQFYNHLSEIPAFFYHQGLLATHITLVHGFIDSPLNIVLVSCMNLTEVRTLCVCESSDTVSFTTFGDTLQPLFYVLSEAHLALENR